MISIALESIFDLLAISTALILGFFFLVKPPKSNIYLGLFLFSLAFEILAPFTMTLAVLNDYGMYFPLHTSLFTLVCLLYYVKKTILLSISRIELCLLIPGVLVNLLFFGEVHEIGFLRFFEYAFSLGIIAYIYYILTQHQLVLLDFYSEIEHKTMSWITSILYVFLFLNLMWIVEDIVGLFDRTMPELFATLSVVITFMLVYWIGYKGISQPELFNQTLFKTQAEPVSASLTPEVNAPVAAEDLTLFNQLKSQIEEEKLYTNTATNLRTLAISLNIKEKELSRLINTCTETNFYHFINTFRVEEFKQLLASPKAEQLSILGLAQEAGFSSKSTFYTAFKKIEGMTPKQYESTLKASE